MKNQITQKALSAMTMTEILSLAKENGIPTKGETKSALLEKLNALPKKDEASEPTTQGPKKAGAKKVVTKATAAPANTDMEELQGGDVKAESSNPKGSKEKKEKASKELVTIGSLPIGSHFKSRTGNAIYKVVANNPEAQEATIIRVLDQKEIPLDTKRQTTKMRLERDYNYNEAVVITESEVEKATNKAEKV
jgi:hypothetical protein